MKTEKKKSKKKPWILFRHKVARVLIGAVFLPYVKLKYNVKITKYKQPKGKPMLVLYNHQTGYDQFFIAAAFKRPVYYVASEDIFSMGFLSKIIKYLVNPIPIKKQTTDARAVINCIRVAKEGGTIAIAPEGNRTFGGATVHIKSSITALARHLGLPIAFFRIEGGYGVHPRWSDVVRHGKMKAGISRVVEPEEYKAMSDDQLYELICNELYCNEATVDGEYRHKDLAEYMERAIYVCPECGLSTFESHGDTIRCKKCRLTLRYTATKELVSDKGESPFRFVNDWYNYQNDYVNDLNLTEMDDSPLYNEDISLYEVVLYKKKQMLHEKAKISLYPDRIDINADGASYSFGFDSITAISVLGKNKLNIYYDGKVYQITGDSRFCALKYVNLCFRYKNLIKGDHNERFLGL